MMYWTILTIFSGNFYIDRVVKFYDNVSTLKANFIERQCEKETGACVEMRGEMYLTKTKLRMNVSMPEKQILVDNGDSLWVKYLDSGEMDVYPSSAFSKFLHIRNILDNYEENFSYKVIREGDLNVIYLLPKDDVGLPFSDLRMYPTKAGRIDRIKAHDAQGNEYDFFLENIRINTELSDTLFRIK